VTGARNVLFIDHTSRLGGAQISMMELMKGLDRKRFSPILACPGKGPLTELAEQNGIEVHCLPVPDIRKTINPFKLALYLLMILRGAASAAALIKKTNASLLHCNTAVAGMYGGPAAKFRRIPCVFHMRDIYSDRKVRAVVGLTARFFATRVIAISGAVAASYRGSEVVYNGVDLDEFKRPDGSRDRIRKDFGVPDGAMLIGTIGQIVPWKGQDILLRALPAVIKGFPGLKCLIVGDVMFKADLPFRRKLIKLSENLGISKNVVFTGFRGDVPDLLGAMDVFVLSSFSEPFGRVIIEAMAAGVPVVAARAGGVPEIIDDGQDGILVKPGDTRELAGSVARLLGDNLERQRLARAAAKKVGSRFSIGKHVGSVERVWEDLLADN